jgi:cyclase
MRGVNMKYFIILVLFLGLVCFIQAESLGLGNPRVYNINENVYTITNLYHTFRYGWVNAGIIFTANSVIFIDCGMTEASGEFLWETASRKMKGKEKIYLILTHSHSDHIFGMNVLKEKGAKVIAHELMIDFLKKSGEKYKSSLIKELDWSQEKGDSIFGEVKLSLPDIVVKKDRILKINGEDIYILASPGHARDQLSVYYPRTKTLFASDVIYQGGDPTTFFGGPEEWRTWINELKRLKVMDINVICPGHGNLCRKDEIDRNIGYLQGYINGITGKVKNEK